MSQKAFRHHCTEMGHLVSTCNMIYNNIRKKVVVDINNDYLVGKTKLIKCQEKINFQSKFSWKSYRDATQYNIMKSLSTESDVIGLYLLGVNETLYYRLE